jgi:hypothetical protein
VVSRSTPTTCAARSSSATDYSLSSVVSSCDAASPSSANPSVTVTSVTMLTLGGRSPSPWRHEASLLGGL